MVSTVATVDPSKDLKASYLGLAVRVKGDTLVAWEVIQPINLSAGKCCLKLYQWGEGVRVACEGVSSGVRVSILIFNHNYGTQGVGVSPRKAGFSQHKLKWRIETGR